MGSRLSAGRTAEVFAYGDDKVVKLFHPGFPLEAVEREYAIAMQLSAAPATVPKVFERVECDGRPGIVYERILGDSMLKVLSRKPWRAFALAQQMARIHQDIHLVRVKDLPHATAVISAQISKAPLISEQEKQEILDQLAHLHDGDRLCHGDFHPDNIIVSEKGLVVIDWITATMGDPLADVARTAVLLGFGSLPPGKGFLEKFITTFFRNFFLAAYLRHYKKITGLSSQDLYRWWVPVATARLSDGVPLSEKEHIAARVRRELH